MNAAPLDDLLAITLDDVELDRLGAGQPATEDDPLWIRILAAWRAETTTGGQSCDAH